jgi:hypothetical protein
MISQKKNFLFIHLPKTGGNSIQNILREYSEDNIVKLNKHQDGIERFGVRNDKYNIKKHSTLDHYKKKIEPEIFKKFFKFSTIRNPWDRCISFYFSPHRGNIVWNRNDFKNLIQSIPTIRKFITTRSLTKKITDKITGKLRIEIKSSKSIDSEIDFLLRFENLNEDFKKVCEIIDIPFKELPHRNKSSKKHYTKYYDDELIELVRNKFLDEIKYANYKYGENNSAQSSRRPRQL